MAPRTESRFRSFFQGQLEKQTFACVDAIDNFADRYEEASIDYDTLHPRLYGNNLVNIDFRDLCAAEFHGSLGPDRSTSFQSMLEELNAASQALKRAVMNKEYAELQRHLTPAKALIRQAEKYLVTLEQAIVAHAALGHYLAVARILPASKIVKSSASQQDDHTEDHMAGNAWSNSGDGASEPSSSSSDGASSNDDQPAGWHLPNALLDSDSKNEDSSSRTSSNASLASESTNNDTRAAFYTSHHPSHSTSSAASSSASQVSHNTASATASPSSAARDRPTCSEIVASIADHLWDTPGPEFAHQVGEVAEQLMQADTGIQASYDEWVSYLIMSYRNFGAGFS